MTFLPKLIKKEVYLQSVNGNSLNVLGGVKIDFSIKSYKMSHVFYVVSDINRNIILGRDWLVQIYKELTSVLNFQIGYTGTL